MSDLIKRYATGQVKALIEKAESIKGIEHDVTKGTLRELFVTDLLSPFLSSQFSIGSGIIINQRGTQSHQTDLIILNNHILPPFIKEQHIGVYPAECVVATIEVKSRLTKKELEKAEQDATHLYNSVYNEAETNTPTVMYKPLCAVFGFYGSGTKELSKENNGRQWLTRQERNLRYFCVAKKFSWIRIQGQWVWEEGNSLHVKKLNVSSQY